jgi:hypothetical protein
MKELSAKQEYHLILADIALAAAIATWDNTGAPWPGGAYTPGCIYEAWQTRTMEDGLRKRVMAMATAGASALQRLPGERLAATAAGFGIPLDAETAELVAEYFTGKREMVLVYNR